MQELFREMYRESFISYSSMKSKITPLSFKVCRDIYRDVEELHNYIHNIIISDHSKNQRCIGTQGMEILFYVNI